MFCVEFSSQSRLSVATIIFYTCIWIPFVGMKQSIRSIIGGFYAIGSKSYSRIISTTDRQTNEIDMSSSSSLSSSSSELVLVECPEDTCWQLDHHHHDLLTVVRFEELEYYYNNSSTTRNTNTSSSSSSLSSSPRIGISNGDVEEDPEEEEVCSVCLGVFQKEEEVSQLSQCGHVFHHRCISSWLHLNRFTCPLCRSPVSNSTSGAAAYAIVASSSSWAT